MRVFCFSFIVYLVVLMTLPCQDMVAMVGDCKAGNSEITHIEQTQNEGSPSDDCSPFCICSCCSLSTADRSTAKYTPDLIANISIDAKAIEYSNPYSKAHQNSIWQPPKA